MGIYSESDGLLNLIPAIIDGKHAANLMLGYLLLIKAKWIATNISQSVLIDVELRIDYTLPDSRQYHFEVAFSICSKSILQQTH